MSVFKPEELFRRLREGHMLVTGNSRLARVLTAQYGAWLMQQGKRHWRSPDILPWAAWLDTLWEQAGLQGTEGTSFPVPGREQLLSLWENVLVEPQHAGALLRPQALAAQAMETRRIAVEWGLDFEHPAWQGDPDENHVVFQRWNRAFEALCRHQGWLAPEHRPARLARAVTNKTFRIKGPIDLLGFDEFFPAQADLLKAIQAAGTPVTQISLRSAARQAGRWKAANQRDELDRMARWARLHYEASPQSSIAIVVPDLQARAAEVERALQQILVPGQALASTEGKPWNFSLGHPLAKVPMIDSAFDLLALLSRRVDIQTIGRVLRSPWTRGASEELAQRAQLEKRLREIYPRQLALREVLYQARLLRRHAPGGAELPADLHEPYPWNCPEFSAVLQTLLAFEQDNRKSQPLSAWADAIDGLLNRCGWPLAGQADASRTEQDAQWQAHQAWQEALRSLSSLDVTSPLLDRAEAVSRLRRICLEQVFQPRTEPVRIQVLGLYEANSLRFDHLWVLGLHGDNWPPAAHPNPFIPRSLQQEHALPHANPQRELEVARTVTARLLEVAPDTVFSYPGQQDGEELMSSPLLETMTSTLDQVPAWEGRGWPQLQARGERPHVGELQMPGPLAGPRARGGSSILKNQALCPFRAFAANRLGAESLESPVDGISAMLHGTLVHRALEGFWRETRSRSALLQLDDEALQARISHHVETALEQERGLQFRPHFREVESKRLRRLVRSYLDLDAGRSDFEVVGFEREILHEIEGQTIRLVIDRMDRLPDGSMAIIDYKTGRVDPKKWFSDRPEDPQLPLYASSADATPFGVVFAVIRDDECVFKGVVRGPEAFPGLPPRRRKDTAYLIDAGEQMEETVAEWKQVLHQLMADFLAGQAAIDPREGRKTCDNSWCELHSLCRIGELESNPAAGSGAPEDRP